jgi:hypothetical protein
MTQRHQLRRQSSSPPRKIFLTVLLWTSLLFLCFCSSLGSADAAAEPLLQFAPSGEDFACTKLLAVQNGVELMDANAGFFCLLLNANDRYHNNVTASYSTQNGWQLQRTAAWLGLSLDDLPTNRYGMPQLNRFPFITEEWPDVSFTLPLNRLVDQPEDFTTALCPSVQHWNVTLFGVAVAELARIHDTTGRWEEADGWADGVLNADKKGELYSIFNVTLQCRPTKEEEEKETDEPVVSSPLLPDGASCTQDSDCASETCISSTNLCGTCLATNSSSILTKDMVQQTSTAATMIAALHDGSFPTLGATNLQTWSSHGHKAMVGKLQGTCFGIFAPETETTTTDDLVQSFDQATTTTTLTAFQQSCPVHSMAYDSYFNVVYKGIMGYLLAQCAATCIQNDTPGAGAGFPTANQQQPQAFSAAAEQIHEEALDAAACPIVLSGHGLGGATAIVAGMDWVDLDPTIITFGAPRTTTQDCTLVDSSRHYRWMNLAYVDSVDTFLFDPIPQLEPKNGSDVVLQHVGTPIVLDGNPHDVVVMEHNNDQTRRASIYSPIVATDRTDTSTTSSFTSDVMIPSHLTLYQERLNVLQSSHCFPIATSTAYHNGHWCDQDDLCLEQRCRPFITTDSLSIGICAQLLPLGSVWYVL